MKIDKNISISWIRLVFSVRRNSNLILIFVKEFFKEPYIFYRLTVFFYLEYFSFGIYKNSKVFRVQLEQPVLTKLNKSIMLRNQHFVIKMTRPLELFLAEYAITGNLFFKQELILVFKKQMNSSDQVGDVASQTCKPDQYLR